VTCINEIIISTIRNTIGVLCNIVNKFNVMKSNFIKRFIKMALHSKSINGFAFHIAENNVNKFRIPKINLTKRERETLYFVCQGYSMKEVANEMFVSPSTIISHKRKLFRKFDVNSLVRLGVLAERYRLTGLPE